MWIDFACHARQPHKPTSPTAVLLSSIVCGTCALYGIYCYATASLYGLPIDSIGFLKVGATQIVLPACLVMLCAGHPHAGAYEYIRVDPRAYLLTEFRWMLLCATITTLCGVGLFAGIDIARTGATDITALRYLALTLLLTWMMNCTISLFVILLFHFGIPYTWATALLLAFYIIADWLLAPLSDTVAKILCWFWYPLSDEAIAVLIYQVLPFAGYCIVVTSAIVALYNRRDRIEW